MAAKLPPIKAEKLGKDVEVEEIAVPKPKKCKHYFIMNGSSEIKCKNCGAGWFIGFGDKLKDGHLYHAGKKIF